VVRRVCTGPYGQGFQPVFGPAVCDDAVAGCNAIARALTVFEGSAEVNPFSSKYDHYLKDPTRFPLDPQEALGVQLFERADEGNFAACHPSRPGPGGEPPLFTDFTFDNLGVPPNPANPWYGMDPAFNPDGAAWVDEGLSGFLKTIPRFADRAAESLGK
jgi:cytochrome c peroxidase